jgi:phage N-6-adenine-methyltransferase
MNVHFSSETDLWSTPQDFFDKLNFIYQFNLDPCTDGKNSKCEDYFTKEDDGLSQDWSGKRVFMNPPYGREIKQWMKKAHEESLKGALVVCLVPSRTDTFWWHEYAMKGRIEFLRGRLKFGDAIDSAPFPSAVVVFEPNSSIKSGTRNKATIKTITRRNSG